jgi:hypothetical protein
MVAFMWGWSCGVHPSFPNVSRDQTLTLPVTRPAQTLFLTLLLHELLPPRSLRRLGYHHLIRLSDQFPQLAPAQGIQPVQHHPLVTADVRRGTNPLALDQLGKTIRRALEAKPGIVEPEHGENLAADFETKVVFPLELLSSMGKGETKFADGIGIHGVRG